MAKRPLRDSGRSNQFFLRKLRLVLQQRNQTGEERKQTAGLSYSAESAEACEGHPQIALDQSNDQESSQQEP